VNALLLGGKTFSLSHTYVTAGSFTVTLRVTDDDETVSRSATITVVTPAQAVSGAIAMVAALEASGKVSAGNASSLRVKLESARAALERGNSNAATGKLNALLHELDAMVGSDRLTPHDVQPLRELVERVVGSVD
jgi:FIMAH domain-containing protein/PKD domain-containing protein